MSLLHQLTKFMGQCSSSASQEINPILGNPNIYCRFHRSSLVVTMVIQSPT